MANSGVDSGLDKPAEQPGMAEGNEALRKTDKAFLIAKPMRKASWTKRFAAGSGERGQRVAWCGSLEGGSMEFGRRSE